jgi:uncharacterized damage-inducible protein DinB
MGMTIAEKLLPEFDEEFANTRKLLALVPDDNLLWKPHEKSMELGRLGWHLADFPEWCRSTFASDSFQMTEEDRGKTRDGWKGKKRADMLEKFDAGLSNARAALAKNSDADMQRHWKMEWDGQTIIDDPRADVYRKWVLNHQVHHRAQLGVYLRMLNVAIPGCYGPSADEMAPQRATAA